MRSQPVPHNLEWVLDGPWVLVIVFLFAGLDAVVPFTPSETTLVAAAAASAVVGQPPLPVLIVAAAIGAFAGDQLAYLLGRRIPADHFSRRPRTSAAQRWVVRLMARRGGLAIMFARYLPGGRSVAAFTAGLVNYPAGRFRWYTGMAVLLWSTQAALLGYLGGVTFADQPLLGVAVGCAIATVVLLVTTSVHCRNVRHAGPPEAGPVAVASRAE
jgi:membrane protein DedA with SNARE-associated domain